MEIRGIRRRNGISEGMRERGMNEKNESRDGKQE